MSPTHSPVHTTTLFSIKKARFLRETGLLVSLLTAIQHLLYPFDAVFYFLVQLLEAFQVFVAGFPVAAPVHF